MNADPKAPRSRLTLRVSRDGGRTYGSTVTHLPYTDRPPESPLRFPPCSCPACHPRADPMNHPPLPIPLPHSSGPRALPTPPCPPCDVQEGELRALEVELRAAERREDGSRVALLRHEHDERLKALRRHRDGHVRGAMP